MDTEFLRKIPFLATLPAEDLVTVSASMQRQVIEAGAVLMREGDLGDCLYLVLSGELEIIKAYATPDARSLGLRGPGQVVGEMSLINPDHRRTATVCARVPTAVAAVARATVDAILRKHPQLALQAMRTLSQRLQEADEATIRDLQEKNRLLTQAYHDLQAAQAQIIANERAEHERQLAQERIAQEQRVAQRIQQALLPKELPDLPGWSMATHYQPARAVGGDFYDFLAFPKGRLGLVIGDATDKGMPAALVMATTRSIVRGVAQGTRDPGAILARTNELLCPDMPPGMFVTCLCAVLNPITGVLRFANAGHDLPYVYSGSAATALRATGMPLGLLPGMHYEEKEVTLQPGDRLCLYSDGLVEAHDRAGQMFGFPRLQQLIAQCDYGSSQGMIQYLLAALAQFTGEGWEQEDDITLITLERL